MIDFRYHLVSIIAIFLALALGLVVGSTALRGTVQEGLKSQAGRLNKENQTLRADKRTLEDRGNYNDQVGAATAGHVIADQLSGESVVFVNAPGADDRMRAQVADMVAKAGARISGYVTLQDKYADAEQQPALDALTRELATDGVTLPPGGTTYDRSGFELAQVLLTRQASRTGQDDSSAGAVLSGFKTRGFLNFSGRPATRATLAVVIAPFAASNDKDTAAQNKALLSLISGLQQSSNGVVVAGTSDAAADGGMVKAVHDDGDLGAKVSTVNTADIPAGQVTTVFALAQLDKQHKTGAYGIGPGVDGPLPTPVPSVIRKK